MWFQEPAHEPQAIVQLDPALELAPAMEHAGEARARNTRSRRPAKAGSGLFAVGAPEAGAEAPPEAERDFGPLPPNEPRLLANEDRGPARRRLSESERERLPDRGGTFGTAAAWAILVVLIAGIVGGAALYRQQIIDYLPPDAKQQAAAVYDWLGLPFELPGYGLKIEVTQSSRESVDNTAVLVIEGKVTNVSQKARSVPRLRAALRDQNNRELQHWFVRLSEDELLSGQTATFRTSIDNPVEAARNLSITFARSE